MSVRKLILAAALTLMLPFSAFAGLFDLTVESGGDSYSLNFSKVEDLFDNFDVEKISPYFPGFDENTSGADLTINFRGLPATLTIAPNSNKYILSIPSAGVYEEFDGADRDESSDKLEDWFKKDGQSALTKVMQKLASDTPSDPIAGNPSSLMSRMSSMDYDMAVSPEASVIEINAQQAPELNANLISVFAKYSNYTVNGVKSKEYALPLAYTIRFNGSKNSLAIRLPMSQVTVEDSTAYNLGLGIALGYQVNDDWRLTPAIGYGAVGSIDLGSVGQIVSGSLTSSYVFHVSKYDLTLGNMAGYYKTIPFSRDDYDIDPDIKNTVLRNGLRLSLPFGEAKTTSLELFVTDTRYFGSDLYIDQYNEIGFSYGFTKVTVKEKGGKTKGYLSSLRGGVTYMTADDADGFTFNLGWSF
ncbi:hypothetical protein [Seleniivibrio woodruffii]|uniref:Uncharacterized protein n=1 Tax=Seleniivibrio woodruffii TaxID=1078050 RepID=A0A4R1K888_9BACT|nr:hypothetical protein [Seleniivibrio woodruffii]TCK60033.1 hypothetical protein C8D98_2205 [Seleniivibrio woodruffii]TVZ35746.1 hypothetical protein OF66_1362 [Seleniivibrio woodruffii]